MAKFLTRLGGTASHSFLDPHDPRAPLAGYTVQVTADSDECTLSLLVRPDTDYDGTFKAWDTDEQCFVRVNGWLFSVEAR